MAFVVLLACIGLLVAAILLVCLAFSQDDKKVANASDRRKRVSLRLLSAGIVAGSLSVLLFVTVFHSLIVRARIVEAEDITRNTFREKIGREPDTLEFDSTDRQPGWNGWTYLGVARVGDEVWDVTVTRSNDRAARKTTLRCEAQPRREQRDPD